MLELGIERQRVEPRFRRIAERGDRLARIREQKPAALLVASKYLWNAVGPTREELGSEVRLECLHRRARLEPGDAVGERHAQHRRPRPLVHGLDRANRLRVQTDPLFDGERVYHDPTIATRQYRF